MKFVNGLKLYCWTCGQFENFVKHCHNVLLTKLDILVCHTEENQLVLFILLTVSENIYGTQE